MNTAKLVNRLRTTVRQHQGPARRDRAATPIADAMSAYWERDMLTFGIPGHNGGRGPAPEFTRWAGAAAARFDLPMSHGVDTRDRAWGVLSTACASPCLLAFLGPGASQLCSNCSPNCSPNVCSVRWSC